MARIRTVFADSDQQRRKLVRDGSQFLALAAACPAPISARRVAQLERLPIR